MEYAYLAGLVGLFVVLYVLHEKAQAWMPWITMIAAMGAACMLFRHAKSIPDFASQYNLHMQNLPLPGYIKIPLSYICKAVTYMYHPGRAPATNSTETPVETKIKVETKIETKQK